MGADANGKIRVMLVDDHEVVRLGLAALIARQPEFEVVGEAGTAREAVSRAATLQPDIVVMDVRMPDGSGIEACREIIQNRPQTKVIILTSYSDDEAVFASIMAGAQGYVLKQIGSESLLAGLRAVARGQSLLDPAITGQVLERMKNPRSQPGGHEPLTEQERRILALIAEGKTNKQIAQEIFLSEKTVRNYVSNILGKLHFARRSQAAAYAVQHHLASPPAPPKGT